MRTIIMMRHGHALDGNFESDFNRNLSPKGLKEVESVAMQLKNYKFLPEIIIASSAHRTLQTMNKMLDILGTNLMHSIERDLYLSDHDSILTQLYMLDASRKNVMLIGHNPAWSTFSTELTGRPIGLSTANCVVLSNDTSKDWNQIGYHGNWQLNQLFKP